MQKIHFSAFLFFFLCRLSLYAQPNLEQYDNKRFHMGFTIAFNSATVRADTKSSYLPTDTLMNVRQVGFPGIGLGALFNFRLNRYFDLRLLFPVFSFTQRNLMYEFPNVSREAKIESVYCDASMLVKYKSERRKNVRFYVIGGLRTSYDFSSTVGQNRSNKSPVVSLVPFTYGYEAGFGLDIYYPYFKFSPELKVSNTVNNALYRDGYIYTNALDRLSPQMVVLSFHFEG